MEGKHFYDFRDSMIFMIFNTLIWKLQIFIILFILSLKFFDFQQYRYYHLKLCDFYNFQILI